MSTTSKKPHDDALEDSFSSASNLDFNPHDDEDYLPRSVELMLSLICNIVAVKYSDQEAPFLDLSLLENETVVLFFSRHVHPYENPEFDIYSDPDFYENMYAFLQDLDEANYETGITIDPENLTLAFTDKLSLFKIIANYLDQNEELISPDSVMSVRYVDDDADELDLTKHMNEIDQGDFRAYNAKYERHKLKQKVAKEFDNNTDQIVSTEAFETIPDRTYTTKSEFQIVAYGVLHNANLGYTLSHILKTIKQEDRLDNATIGQYADILGASTGGYN